MLSGGHILTWDLSVSRSCHLLYLSSDDSCMSPYSVFRWGGGGDFMHREKELQTSISFLVWDQASSITAENAFKRQGWYKTKTFCHQDFSSLFVSVHFISRLSNIIYSDSPGEDIIYSVASQNLHAPCWNTSGTRQITQYILEIIHVNEEYKWAMADAPRFKSNTVQIQQIKLWWNPKLISYFYQSRKKSEVRIEQETVREETVKQWTLSEQRLIHNKVRRWKDVTHEMKNVRVGHKVDRCERKVDIF